MDDLSFVGDTFESCSEHLCKALERYSETNLMLNYSKWHFMLKDDIVLTHKNLGQGSQVYHVKVEVITNISPPFSMNGVQSFLGHDYY